jgi:dihydroorotate dehydrogenase electron transfer subunit
MDAMRTVRILDVVRDSSRHVTIAFRDPLLRSYEPGQFLMVWVPGVDEVPMAVWGGQDGVFKILVEAKGDGTRALAAMAPGDVVGVRGPYGKPFRTAGRRVLFVVGGTGTSPLVPLAERVRGRTQVDVVVGARSREFVLLRTAYEAAGARVFVSTDDGSEGFHGRAPDLARQRLEADAYDEVLTCGPERMMKAVVDLCLARGVPVQASLERWMKCAVGICDACLVDGIRLCRDGPVLAGDTLARLDDFGRFERDPSGTRRPIH